MILRIIRCVLGEMGVLVGFAYNFCYGRYVSGGYFATEEKEEKREIREKICNFPVIGIKKESLE